MRLVSTYESVERGEVSVLAIVETILAMTATVLFGVYFNTWKHLAIEACIAPLLLLRTEISASLSMKILNNATKAWGQLSKFQFLAMPVLVISARLFSVPITFARHPLLVLRSFPKNWKRTTLSLDSGISPEWFPAPANSTAYYKQLCGVYHIVKDTLKWAKHCLIVTFIERSWHEVAIMLFRYCLVFPVVTFFAATAIAYRWSIKSTALIWLPLLWALMPPKPPADAWNAHLKLKATSDINRIVTVFSLIVILGFLWKYGLFITKHALAVHAEAWNSWLGARLGEFVSAFVRPGEFPIWQIASLVNSILALFVFFLIRSWLRHADANVPIADRTINGTLGSLLFVRRLLTSYVILCNLYVVVRLARELPVPQIGSKLFPWV